MSQISALCCNPFEEKGHYNVKKNLRSVSQWMVDKNPVLSLQQKICDKCRKKLSKVNTQKNLETEDDQDSLSIDIANIEPINSSSSDEESVVAECALENLNVSLQSLGESPVKRKRLHESKYSKCKMQKIAAVIQTKVMLVSSDNELPASDTESEIISQLKEKFHETKTRAEKLQILTILPKSWSLQKLQNEFQISNYMARKAKLLVRDKGILSSPNPKPGKTLKQEIVDLVHGFYCCDDMSRSMPGKKDYVSIKVNAEKIQVQKRLVLNNLREIYAQFKDKYPNVHIGFSKFAELRPKNCILAGASGTHSVCVCTIHQNFKLMLLGCKLPQLTVDDELPIQSYKDCIARIICNPPLPACYFSECEYCPGSTSLKNYIKDLLERNYIDHVTFKQWVSVDRTTLETITKSSGNFLDSFFENLKSLLRHSFIASQQSYFQSNLKSKLKDGEFLVVCDFSENYSFVLQDEAQGYHWTNLQATIHPFVTYYMDNDQLKHTSLVIISESLQHNTVAVHLFQNFLIDFLASKLNSKPKKIFYFSDGSAAQYKNRKNFINLCMHETDFHASAEWHFTATAHGKGACDGVGGTVKRLAARASLQRPYSEQIMTPQKLFEFASNHIEGIEFKYATLEDHIKEENKLKDRFNQACAIPGTLKLHTFIPIDKNKIETKIYSNSQKTKIEYVTLNREKELDFHEITGYITCSYDGNWWLGCVVGKDELEETITVSFLHPYGPSPSFAYPEKPDILTIHKTDVSTIVNPQTATGRMYTLSQEEMLNASRKMQ